MEFEKKVPKVKKKKKREKWKTKHRSKKVRDFEFLFFLLVFMEKLRKYIAKKKQNTKDVSTVLEAKQVIIVMTTIRSEQ